MKDWQVIPEIIGRNATLRMATMQAVDAVEQGLHFVVEGEAGSGRRLLARGAWGRWSHGGRSMFTMDCRMFCVDGAETLLFGQRSSSGANTTLHPGKLNLAMGGALLLLHAEFLPLDTQSRLAEVLESRVGQPRSESMELMMTCTSSLDAPLSLHPELSALLIHVRVPALRDRLADIRAIAAALLRNASPFDPIRCSPELIERFCEYDWPGNVTELRSVLRKLLMEPHNGLLDVCHLVDVMCRYATCSPLARDGHPPSAAQIESSIIHHYSSAVSRSMQ